VVTLLAPGGSVAAVQAAVAAGADGVYCGFPAASRAEGRGLTRDEVAVCLDIVHRRGRFLHLAANAVPGDTASFRAVLAGFRDLGVDGVILNDPGLIARTVRDFPGWPVYASVGLGVSNREDALFYAALGVRAVVLAPDTAREVLAWPRDPAVGVEVFCDLEVEPLMTGRCALSSYTRPPGEKAASVKRGNPCRQPCRLPWTGAPASGSPFPWRHHTLTDMTPYLRAGVSLFKIQGRRLAPPAVAALVERYRRQLDQARERIANGKE